MFAEQRLGRIIDYGRFKSRSGGSGKISEADSICNKMSYDKCEH